MKPMASPFDRQPSQSRRIRRTDLAGRRAGEGCIVTLALIHPGVDGLAGVAVVCSSLETPTRDAGERRR
jgi:hypothetical protein